jgi:hypothetical protein
MTYDEQVEATRSLEHLASDAEAEGEDAPLIPDPSGVVSPPTPLSGKKVLQVILLCASATLILDIGLTVVRAPKIRLFESILCQAYYRTHGDALLVPMQNIPESRCKTKEIQSGVARLIGWQTVFDGIPGMSITVSLTVRMHCCQIKCPNPLKPFSWPFPTEHYPIPKAAGQFYYCVFWAWRCRLRGLCSCAGCSGPWN